MKFTEDPAKDSRNIVIRLIRETKDEQKDTDDMIVIHHKGEDLYHVFYQDGYFSDKSRYHMTVHDGESLDIYIRSLFRLVSSDRDPFRAVQFNIPGFPCLYYTPKDFLRKALRIGLMRLMPIQVGAINVFTN